MISVIIATKNRPSAIMRCVTSILSNTENNFEILIVDQSDTETTHAAITQLHNYRVHYLKDKKTGKSHALNIGIAHAKGDILAFTDDDCIVRNDWLSAIQKNTLDYVECSAFFGTTLPYQPNKHKGDICPSVFMQRKHKNITQPCRHSTYIGFGNNMAIRAQTIQTVGGFALWLGPGSVGSGAEDAEMALRILINNHVIHCDPKMIVYHNRWLRFIEAPKQALSYACGEVACYGYFSLQKFAFAYPVLKSAFPFKEIYSRRDLFEALKTLIYQLRGLFVAIWYSYQSPIRLQKTHE